MIVLDTNVVAEPLRVAAEPRVVAWLDSLDENNVWLTTITAAELSAGVEKLAPGHKRDALEAQVAAILYQDFLDRILPFDLNAAECYGAIVGPILRSGPASRTMDFQIAAIAISHGATLATRNVKDFQGIDLALVNPWTA